MAVRSILQLGNPALREVCRPIAEPDGAAARSLAEDLQHTLAHHRNRTGFGRGIAAPQIGVPARVVHIELDGSHTLINPVITARSEETMEIWDFCLSFFTIVFPVRRHVLVEVRCKDLEGREQRLEAVGNLAELLQHEIDHLDGVLAIDRVTDVRRVCAFSEWVKRNADDNEQIVAEAVRTLQTR